MNKKLDNSRLNSDMMLNSLKIRKRLLRKLDSLLNRLQRKLKSKKPRMISSLPRRLRNSPRLKVRLMLQKPESLLSVTL